MTDNEAMGEAAGLIREHLWLGKTAPPPPHPNDRAWHMGRDLSIWKQLRKGWSAEDIALAIENVRDLLPNQAGVPLSMRILYHTNATPLFEQAVSLAHKRKPKKRQLPPTIRDVLRGMVG